MNKETEDKIKKLGEYLECNVDELVLEIKPFIAESNRAYALEVLEKCREAIDITYCSDDPGREALVKHIRDLQEIALDRFKSKLEGVIL